MKILIFILLWLVLFAVNVPLALAALVLLPVLWVMSILLRLVVWCVEACLALIKTLLFLPARLLGYRRMDGTMV